MLRSWSLLLCFGDPYGSVSYPDPMFLYTRWERNHANVGGPPTGELLRITLPKLSKKSLGGVSSVGIAAITRRNEPILPASGPPGTLVLELTGVFRQFLRALR